MKRSLSKEKQKSLFHHNILKIKMKELMNLNYGSPDNITSPLGFLRVTLHFKQEDPDYLNIYAPCDSSTLELLRRYVPEVTALYSANVSSDKEIKDLYDAALRRYNKISDENRRTWIKLRNLIYKIKHNKELKISSDFILMKEK